MSATATTSASVATIADLWTDYAAAKKRARLARNREAEIKEELLAAFGRKRKVTLADGRTIERRHVVQNVAAKPAHLREFEQFFELGGK